MLQQLSRRLRTTLNAALLLIAVFALIQSSHATTPLADDQLIPRRILFADEDKLNVRLDPGGMKLCYVTPAGNVDGVWMCPIDNSSTPELLFEQTDAPVLNLQWAFTPQQLVYLKPVAKEVHLFVFDVV